RHQLDAAVVLQELDLRAQRVDMRGKGAGRLVGLAGNARADGAATGDLVGDAKPLQLRAAVGDDAVGVAAGAGDGQQRAQLRQQVVAVDGWQWRTHAGTASAAGRHTSTA